MSFCRKCGRSCDQFGGEEGESCFVYYDDPDWKAGYDAGFNCDYSGNFGLDYNYRDLARKSHAFRLGYRLGSFLIEESIYQASIRDW